MKKERHAAAPAFGASALLVVFSVLCLTVFAMLALSTAQAERRLSDTSAAAVQAYYAADLEAEEIFARLRAGEQVETVARTGGIYSYSCPISENQTLKVELEKTDGAWKVLRWQVEADPPQTEQVLPVWKGN